MSLAARGKVIIASVQESGLARLVWRYGKDRADVMAAVVAFNLLFSTFPIILGVLAIVGLIVRGHEAQAVALSIVLSPVPMEGAASMLEAINVASQSAGSYRITELRRAPLGRVRPLRPLGGIPRPGLPSALALVLPR